MAAGFSDRALADALESLTGGADPDLDVSGLLYTLAATSVELVGTHTAGVSISDDQGGSATVASCGLDDRHVTLFSNDLTEGPGAECTKTGDIISRPDLTLDDRAWPDFTALALDLGFRSVHAVPIRTNGHVIGSLVLVQPEPRTLEDATLMLAQAFARVAGVIVLLDRNERSHALVREQLEGALQSRVVIEQAKGYLARHYLESPNDAFNRLRAYARDRNLRIATVASDVIARRLDLS